jgi:hypothetical protein
MKTQNIVLAGLTLVGAALLPMAAQAQTPYPHPHTLNQRFHDQNARINQGVRDDQLTRREARNDRFRLDRVRYQDQRDRDFHGGHLTTSDRRHQEAELNRNSKDIYRTKHNDYTR